MERGSSEFSDTNDERDGEQANRTRNGPRHQGGHPSSLGKKLPGTTQNPDRLRCWSYQEEKTMKRRRRVDHSKTALDQRHGTRRRQESTELLGIVNYYQNYLQNFATMTESLRKLTRKGVDFNWDKDSRQSFQAIKDSLPKNIRLHILFPKPKHT